MKICITGGAGFIGSNFIYYMLDKYDYEIVCFDKLTYAGNIGTLEEALKNERFSFVQGDIADKDSVDELFSRENFDVVMNFAAESHVDRSIENPEIFVTTNIKGTVILMDACIKYNVGRFHQISTDEVYGELSLNDENLHTEESVLNPSSPYSASKAGADMMVKAYYRTYSLPVSISRSSNNYGPHQYPEKLIPLMIFKAMNNEELPVYGTGVNIRDWLYVKDHCRALDLIIHNGKTGEIYNIASHNEKKNIDVVRMILQETDNPESLISFVSDRLGHDLRYGVDTSKIENELGWKPEYDFQTGLKETINWYKDKYSQQD